MSSGDALQKADLLNACRLLAGHGYTIYATGGTYRYLVENEVAAERVLWPSETEDPELSSQFKSALKMLQDKEIDLVVNIPKNFTSVELANGYKIRRAAIDFNIPLITNARLATAFIRAFCCMGLDDIQIKSWDQY